MPRWEAAVFLALAAAAWWIPALSLSWARPALIKFGPNDAGYVTGFRPDWERDGLTRFRWTSPAARVELPLHVRGEGLVMRARIRRHLIEPARVTLRVEERTVATFDLQADTKVPYRVVQFALPPLEGRAPFSLLIYAPSDNPRPLGIAMDWLEVQRAGPEARFELTTRLRVALLLAVLGAVLAPRLAGLGWASSLGHGCALMAAAAAGTAWDVIATERIAREGLGAYLAVATLAVGLARWRASRAALQVETRRAAGILVLLILVAVAVRLVLLLHPQFYYPDVKVHAMFVWQLARRGLAAFLEEFTVNQYRYSLGLQFESGHWYAFPYPPAFYILTWPLVRLLGYRPEVAVSVLAAAVNSLEAFLLYAIARRLRIGPTASLAAAAALPLLPLFLARLSLAYFPALFGHAVDALVLLYLTARASDLHRPRVVLTLAALLALALLAYTQSVLNFGFLLPLFLLLQLAFDRTPGARKRQVGLVAAGLLGGALSVALFYGRYIPILLDMRQGIPMAEEQVLLDKLARRTPGEEPAAVEPPDDPYAGPGLDLSRGVRKAAWRMYIFYGLFAPVIAVGLVLICRQTPPALARLVAAWGATYVLLNLASAGLPGPNLFRYNKDLEVVAPLCCVALGQVGLWLGARARVLGLAYAAAFWWFGAQRGLRYLTEKFVLER